MKKLILFLCVSFFVVGVTPTFAMTIDVWEVTNDNTSQINDWIGAQHGSVHVLEDFEDIEPGWYTQKDTGVGTFTAEGDIGTGATSYNKNHDEISSSPYFSIQEDDDDWYRYGRNNTTTGEDAREWLDSGDITLLTLTLKDTSLTNLFFYIQDPGEFSVTTLFVNDDNDPATHYKFSKKANKASFFVGISWTDEEVLSTLSWATKSQSDGFGLDDFSTIQNPEPATMFLFGFGLIGIAGITRRMI